MSMSMCTYVHSFEYTYPSKGTGEVLVSDCDVVKGTVVEIMTGSTKTNDILTEEIAPDELTFKCQYYVNFDGDIYGMTYTTRKPPKVGDKVEVVLIDIDTLNLVSR